MVTAVLWNPQQEADHYGVSLGGVHRLCADTKFGEVGEEGPYFLHFNAKPGAAYFFEVRNMLIGDPGMVRFDPRRGFEAIG